MEVEQEVPAEVAVTRFAAARALEIENLTAMLESTNSNKLIFQKLPKHMRRRAMSHNPNRLPRRLREAHISQREKSGGSAETKRPSRKYRRRPSRLRDSYKERVKDKSWLETHIWHAKRFHMVTQCGYKLPFRSCEKGFRASYRAVSNYCLLQDVSYLCCVEIAGSADLITRGFAEITNEKTGPSLKPGPREGSLVLYKRNTYPCEAIGTVTYFWKPHDDDNLATQTRQLWLWVHPAFHEDVLHQLNVVFGLNVDEFKPSLRYGNKETGVSLCLLKDSLSRFRLRGPTSKSVLSAAYEVKGIQLESIEVPPRLVCEVRIRDPRMTLPVKRTGAANTGLTTATLDIESLPQDLKVEDLWDPDIRDSITKHRKILSDLEINKRRQQLLVPGSHLPTQPDEKDIPLFLIHSSRGSSEEVGWDIIGPPGWATALWLPLVYNGARVGGLFDAEVLNYESNILPDTKLEPDTAAGMSHLKKKEEELMETYFKKPPKKRENFIKLGVPCPFNPNWDLLAAEWTSTSSSFFILRDRDVLHKLKNSSQIAQEIRNFLNSLPCLVEVTVTLPSGTPEDYSMIYCPLEGDSGSLLEPQHGDEKAKERGILKKQHKEELAKLQRKRKDLKKEGSEVEKFNSKEICQNFNEKMRNLWLPTLRGIRECNSRPVAGFVIQGGFSLKRGKGFGRGYVVGASLCHLSDRRVLVRNINSLQFHWGTLDIV